MGSKCVFLWDRSRLPWDHGDAEIGDLREAAAEIIDCHCEPSDQVIIYGEVARIEPNGDPRSSDPYFGANLQHALLLAGEVLAKDSAPVRVVVVASVPPCAHLLEEGNPFFSWPPSAETFEVTRGAADAVRTRAPIHAVALSPITGRELLVSSLGECGLEPEWTCSSAGEMAHLALLLEDWRST